MEKNTYAFTYLCATPLPFHTRVPLTCTPSLQTDTFHTDHQLPKTVGKNRQHLVLIDLKITEEFTKVICFTAVC